MADSRRAPFRLGIAASAALILSGCGGSAPTKAQFMSRTRGAIGDVKSAMVSKGIDPKVGDQIIDDLIACEYEAIKDDPELLQAAYEHAGKSDVVAKLDAKAGSCSREFTAALTKAADGVRTTAGTTGSGSDATGSDSDATGSGSDATGSDATGSGSGDEMTTIAPSTSEATTR